MKNLFAKLETLPHFHYTPKPVNPEVEIIHNVPTMAMERVWLWYRGPDWNADRTKTKSGSEMMARIPIRKFRPRPTWYITLHGFVHPAYQGHWSHLHQGCNQLGMLRRHSERHRNQVEPAVSCLPSG